MKAKYVQVNDLKINGIRLSDVITMTFKKRLKEICPQCVAGPQKTTKKKPNKTTKKKPKKTTPKKTNPEKTTKKVVCRCAKVMKPVCTKNAKTNKYKTYNNECEAKCAGQKVVYGRKCDDLTTKKKPNKTTKKKKPNKTTKKKPNKTTKKKKPNKTTKKKKPNKTTKKKPNKTTKKKPNKTTKKKPNKTTKKETPPKTVTLKERVGYSAATPIRNKQISYLDQQSVSASSTGIITSFQLTAATHTSATNDWRYKYTYVILPANLAGKRTTGYTGWSFGAEKNAEYLDRHLVGAFSSKCEFLNYFGLQRGPLKSNNQDVRYKFVTIKAPCDGSIKFGFSGCNALRGKKMEFLDRHKIAVPKGCGLTGFQLTSTGCSGLNMRYKFSYSKIILN